VHGEVDIGTAEALELAIDDAIRESDGAFIIDLSGLHVLLRARSLLAREDRALAVVCPPGHIRRVLELSGTADLFFMYGSREEAAAALVPPDSAAEVGD
jgi:anti-anti-sigma factor